jgi:hypothetical protein
MGEWVLILMITVASGDGTKMHVQYLKPTTEILCRLSAIRAREAQSLDPHSMVKNIYAQCFKKKITHDPN